MRFLKLSPYFGSIDYPSEALANIYNYWCRVKFSKLNSGYMWVIQTLNIGLVPRIVAGPPLSAIGEPSALQHAAP